MSKPKSNHNFARAILQNLSKFPLYDPKKIINLNSWFSVILIYITVINLFIFKTTPEVIFLQYLVIVIIFLKVRSKEFTKDWVPFIGLFLIYEFLRGHVDNISPFYDTTLFWIHNLELTVFGSLPTETLQHVFGNNGLVVNFSLFFYSIFFYYSFLVAFLIWVKDRILFKQYSRRFLILSYVGLVFFFLIPTAPPWFVPEVQASGIQRLIYNHTILDGFSGYSFYQYFIYGNAVAALPSLHVAWPTFSTLFLIKNYKSKWLYLLLIVPTMIAFSVVLAAEHYVLDVLAGGLLAHLILNFNSDHRITSEAGSHNV